uniref:Uncharacterized protein n=1 Tax=Timema poppense TaxID=170557 RepID=A0A7R9DP34_TIMPO|nr:unnamed protein product [Timema poppensis]
MMPNDHNYPIRRLFYLNNFYSSITKRAGWDLDQINALAVIDDIGEYSDDVIDDIGECSDDVIDDIGECSDDCVLSRKSDVSIVHRQSGQKQADLAEVNQVIVPCYRLFVREQIVLYQI